MIWSERGMSLVEVLSVIVIMGLLVSIARPTYQEAVRRSREKQSMAHLADYYRGAKLVLIEFGYNPGNFHAVGFNAEGTLYHRIATSDTGERLPMPYPDDPNCVSTEPLPPGSSHDISHNWTEVDTNFLATPKPFVSGKKFKVYAYPSAGSDPSQIICIDESGSMQFGDCS